MASLDPDRKVADAARGLKELQENKVILWEFEELKAELARHRYNTLLSKGFTESQAIEICKEMYK